MQGDAGRRQRQVVKQLKRIRQQVEEDGSLARKDRIDIRFKWATAVFATFALLATIGTATINYRSSQSALQAANANLAIAEQSGAVPVLHALTLYETAGTQCPTLGNLADTSLVCSTLTLDLRNEGRANTDIAAASVYIGFPAPNSSCSTALFDRDYFAGDDGESIVLQAGLSSPLAIHFADIDLYQSPVHGHCIGAREETLSYELSLDFGNGCSITREGEVPRASTNNPSVEGTSTDADDRDGFGAVLSERTTKCTTPDSGRPRELPSLWDQLVG